MNRGVAALVGIAIVVCGCRESDEGRLADDDTLEVTTPIDSSSTMMYGSDSGAGNEMVDEGGLTGEMESDLAMMSQMMIERLGEADSTYDARFIRMMIPHHEGGIAMAKDAVAKAMSPELRRLAQSMASSEQSEIDRMKGWLVKWYGDSAGVAAPGMGGRVGGGTVMKGDMIGKMTELNRMMVEQLGAKDSAYDSRFIDIMTSHHESAVAMSRDAAAKGSHAELKALAASMAAAQEKEIATMGGLRGTSAP